MTVSAPLGPDPHAGLRITLLYGVYDVLWTVALLLTSPWWIVRSLMHPPTRGMVRGRLTLNLRALPPAPDRPRRRDPGKRSRRLVCIYRPAQSWSSALRYTLAPFHRDQIVDKCVTKLAMDKLNLSTICTRQFVHGGESEVSEFVHHLSTP